MRAIRLRTEYLYEPIGIDITRPRFYWNCEGGKRQSAYRIVCRRGDAGSVRGGSNSAAVADASDGIGGEVVWDSGKVTSSSMTHIRYEGSELHSRDHIAWTVILWDENDVEGEATSAHFEMGLMSHSDWQANFISGDYKPKKGVRYPVDCFKREWQPEGVAAGKTIATARLYATAHGVYDVRINGTLLTDHVLAPGITDYRKRLQYQTYDIVLDEPIDEVEVGVGTGGQSNNNQARERNSANICPPIILELRLGDGWYRGCTAAYSVENVYGVRTSVMAQLELTYTDGTREILVTDDSWQWSNDGEIRFSDLKDGEEYDAGMSPTYNGHAVIVKPERNVRAAQIVASNNVPVCEQEHFTATLLTAQDGSKVFDFGQNIAGRIKFRVRGQKGQKAHLVCGEILDESGHVDLKNIQSPKPARGWTQMSIITMLTRNKVKGESVLTPKQTIEFIASGGEDYYSMSFSVFGFRYAELTGDLDIESEDIEAVAVYSDMERVGSFSCSNPLINKLHENTLWSMKGNFLDIPTDCPTRERLGWSGDGQIFFNTGSFMMDTAAFMRKWAADMRDSRYKNGLVPAVFPYEGVEMMYKATGGSVGWADIIYLLPYRYYLRYGDRSILEENWTLIEDYADYLTSHLGLSDKKRACENPDNAYTYEKGVHLGEWLEPEEFRDEVYGASAKHPEECTAYMYLAMTVIGDIASILGHSDCAKKCAEYAAGAKRAYKHLFVDTGTINTKRQAKLVRPLALGLLDGDDKGSAERLLREAVESYNYRVGTGFLSTPFILPVLTAAGDIETAYKMLENEESPGWLAEVKAGATTVWETWEGDLSRNHYSPGAVCEWLYNTICGIIPDGENHFIIAPQPGGTLTEATADYNSIYGNVISGWKRESEAVIYYFTIPVNTTAEVRLPGGEAKRYTPGRYEVRVRT